jgi:hypothetical protein
MKTKDKLILSERSFRLHGEHSGHTVNIHRLFSHASYSLKTEKRAEYRFQVIVRLFMGQIPKHVYRYYFLLRKDQMGLNLLFHNNSVYFQNIIKIVSKYWKATVSTRLTVCPSGLNGSFRTEQVFLKFHRHFRQSVYEIHFC